MSIKKFSMMLLSTMAMAALLNGCGTSSKEGTSNPGGVAKVDEATCRVCHSTTLDPVSKTQLLPEFLGSVHNLDAAGCQGCHGGGVEHNGVGPIPFPDPLDSSRCSNISCHGDGGINKVPTAAVKGLDFNATCGPCHLNPLDPVSAKAGVHGAQTTAVSGKTECLDCHDIAREHGPGLVSDNSGIRAITPEFNKRSHHITGGAPKSAQCAVCHLEGKLGAAAGQAVVDPTYHMKDNKIYLRNADDDTAIAWSGTEHTAMDNFCFSCHDSNGATSAGIAAIMAGQNFGGAFSATNPFADTLQNGYDQVIRAGVVDVKTAFTSTNASHHAVSGQRYKYRFSTAANAAAWVARDPAHRTMPPASQIAEGHTDLDGNPIPADAFAETMTGDFSLDTVAIGNGSGSFAFTGQPAGTSQYLPKGEGEATLYEAEKFVSTYIPLGATQNVADNSTLHCGDCHTVGQWKKGSSTNADGTATGVAIGAHGSANEYLLRNSLGTDALHNNLTYVCFNCHIGGGLTKGTFNSATAGFGALHPVQNKNQVLGYATTHAVSAFHIQCLADSANNIGAVDRLAKSWEADKTTADYGTFPLPAGGTVTIPAPAGGSDAGWGNITGIACTACHNSALRSGFGGIHGGDNTYTDGFNRTQKSYRFMPGMGNYRYAPPGGWDNKDTSVVAPAGSAAAGKPVGGCYTNGAADTNAGYSACSHHGSAVAPAGSPTAAGGSAPVLGGGTANAPFTNTGAEYTVREATAGNALVTRPLKY